MPVPSLSIDLVPVCLALCAMVSLMCLSLARKMRGGPVQLELWAIGGLLISLGVLLIVLRGLVPDLFSILIANVVLILGYGFLAAGTRVMSGASARIVPFLALAGVAIFVTAYGLEAEMSLRKAIISAVIALFAGMMLHEFLKPGWRASGLGGRLAIVALSITTALALVRALINLGSAGGIEAPFDFDVLAIGLGVVITLGMIGTLMTMSAPLALPLIARSGRREPSDGLEEEAQAGWQLAPDRNALVAPDGTRLRLTGNEYLVLQRLSDHAAGPVPRTTLNALIGRPADNPKDRSIDILISRLRRKCSEAGAELPITTVRGQGYLFHGTLANGEGG
jgi:DNA-binding response OmpR family regulator